MTFELMPVVFVGSLKPVVFVGSLKPVVFVGSLKPIVFVGSLKPVIFVGSLNPCAQKRYSWLDIWWSSSVNDPNKFGFKFCEFILSNV